VLCYSVMLCDGRGLHARLCVTPWLRSGPEGMFDGFIKGLTFSAGPAGQFVGEEPDTGGSNGIRFGDGCVRCGTKICMPQVSNSLPMVKHDIHACACRWAEWSGWGCTAVCESHVCVAYPAPPPHPPPHTLPTRYHDYLLAGFTSCNHQGLIPNDRTILSASIHLHPSRIFGVNPFVNGTVALKTDMVGWAAELWQQLCR
jgi:hypothetical protein